MAEGSDEGRDDSDENGRGKTIVPYSMEIPMNMELAKPGKHESTKIFVTTGMEILDAWSILTASSDDGSFRCNTYHTESSSFGSWSFAEGDDPKSQLDKSFDTNKSTNPLEITCVPYAQLCYDPEQNTLVTFIEINLASADGQRSRRICLVDQKVEVETNGSLSSRTTAGTDSTVSVHFEDEIDVPDTVDFRGLQSRFDESIVYCSTPPENWVEVAQLDLYLLHECHDDPWEIEDKAQRCCTEALKKCLVARKSLKVVTSRSVLDDPNQKPFSGIGYSILQDK